ncbi:MAG TPA: hypothetical protein VF883_05090 [Thermoanaerobaculia bacterium]
MITAAIAGTTAAADDVLRVSIESQRFALRGFASPGRVVLLGMSVHANGGTITQIPFVTALTDDDSDGLIRYAPEAGIPFRSLCAAVDLATGVIAIATPDGYSVRTVEVDRKDLRSDPEGLLDALRIDGSGAYLLIVRPGAGAWFLHAHDGGAHDGDSRRNGSMSLAFDGAQPLLGMPAEPPRKLRTGDVLIALDPTSVELRTLTVTKGR